jgi:hypothetical protein
MLKALWRGGQMTDEEELLKRAMGHLYLNPRARDAIRRRLGRRKISKMSEQELFALVSEIIEEVQFNREW